MTWRRRIVELMCAGGTLTASSACFSHRPIGNAAPDACICNGSPPDSPQCRAETACADNGGSWVFYTEHTVVPDAGSAVEGHCVYEGPDAGVGDPAPIDGPPPPPPVDALPRD